uniref:Uncharacterized protein n=1 Tax=Anguilla anguilla TaxID=7936 RepID=A0A0E9RGJ6_ANGAN
MQHSTPPLTSTEEGGARAGQSVLRIPAEIQNTGMDIAILPLMQGM